jgi:hypothetical protein
MARRLSPSGWHAYQEGRDNSECNVDHRFHLRTPCRSTHAGQAAAVKDVRVKVSLLISTIALGATEDLADETSTHPSVSSIFFAPLNSRLAGMRAATPLDVASA